MLLKMINIILIILIYQVSSSFSFSTSSSSSTSTSSSSSFSTSSSSLIEKCKSNPYIDMIHCLYYRTPLINKIQTIISFIEKIYEDYTIIKEITKMLFYKNPIYYFYEKISKKHIYEYFFEKKHIYEYFWKKIRTLLFKRLQDKSTISINVDKLIDIIYDFIINNKLNKEKKKKKIN